MKSTPPIVITDDIQVSLNRLGMDLETEKVHHAQIKKQGSDYFVKKVDEIAAQTFVQKRQSIIFETFFSEQEQIARFKKKLRQRSKASYLCALKRAKYKCSVCGIGGKTYSTNILQLHHIVPITEYWDRYYKHNSLPEKRFEISNLAVLCPNCHSFIHEIIKQKDLSKKYDIFQEWVDMYGGISDEGVEMFVSITNKKPVKEKTIFEDNDND